MKEFVESLEAPRRILLMVKAGAGTGRSYRFAETVSGKERYHSWLMAVTPLLGTFAIRRNRELSAEGFNLHRR